MKALVVSDSHGFSNNLVRALEREPDCPLVFFLGDGLRDLARVRPNFSGRKFIAVTGNCDLESDFEDYAYKYIEGNTVIACHGHTVSVKKSVLSLLNKAESVRANVALYGHTHRADCYYDSYSKIYAVNPGALCSGNYAVLDFTQKGVDVKFKSLY